MTGVIQSAKRETTSGPDLSEDDLFELLSNERRRFTVHALKRPEAPRDLGSLAEQVAAWEYDIDIVEVDAKKRKRVYTSLQQSHLPKMDSVGVVNFNKNRGTVEPTPALDDCDIYLEILKGREIPWSEYYLVLSSIGIAVVVVSLLNVWPFGLIPELALTVFVVVAFAVSTIAHWYFSRQWKLGATETPPKRT